jgi:hypothetical protein
MAVDCVVGQSARTGMRSFYRCWRYSCWQLRFTCHRADDPVRQVIATLAGSIAAALGLVLDGVGDLYITDTPIAASWSGFNLSQHLSMHTGKIHGPEM